MPRRKSNKNGKRARRHSADANKSKSGGKRSGPPSGLQLARTVDGTGWVLVHPRCARDRTEDLEEVQAMIDAGEFDVASEELRWLVSGCSEFLQAHCLLGELAISAKNDVSLARGHFGCAYQLGHRALARAQFPTPLPYRQPANRPFYLAGRGLAWCLQRLDKSHMASEIVELLVRLDPSDPLRLPALLDDLQTGGLPIIDLQAPAPNTKGSITSLDEE